MAHAEMTLAQAKKKIAKLSAMGRGERVLSKPSSAEYRERFPMKRKPKLVCADCATPHGPFTLAIRSPGVMKTVCLPCYRGGL